MSYLLDTCVVSELTKPRPSKTVAEWLKSNDEGSFFLSVITLGEIEKGIAKLPDSRKKRAIEVWLRSDLLPRFGKRLLPVSRKVAVIWGRMQGEAEKEGAPLPTVDSLIAATAQANDLVVVTRNGDDIERCGVEVLDPWD